MHVQATRNTDTCASSVVLGWLYRDNTYKEINDAGKGIIISDEKYRITESKFGERSEESESAGLIRKTYNLESHQKLEKVQDEQ